MDVGKFSARTAHGFTVFELITTVAVIVVSIALLAPGMNGIADRSRATATANQVLTDLRFARNSAVTRREMVSLCPSNDGKQCSGDPSGWHLGYIVFVDTDGDRQRDPLEPLLRVNGPTHGGVALRTTKGRPAVRFRPDGAAWSTNTTFSVCVGDNPKNHRAVVLYGSGRARVDRRSPGNRPVACA